MSRKMVLGVLLIPFVAVAALRGDEKPGPPLGKQADPLPEHALFRFGSTSLTHPSAVQALAASPDGKVLAVCCAGGLVSLLDAKTFQLLRRLEHNEVSVTSLAFTPD